MSEVRQALVAWEQHLEEVIGVAHSARVVDRFDEVVTPELLEITVQRIRMERQADLGILRGEMGSLRGGLRGEMESLGAGLRGEMESLRGEMQSLRGDLHADMAELRLEMRTEIAASRQDLSDRIERQAISWRRDLLLVTGAQFTALAGAVLVLA